MTRAFVLMTAMPPTKGHLHLIQFAANLATSVTVIVNTQPDEPYSFERVSSIQSSLARTFFRRDIQIVHIDKYLPQEPKGNPGFWDMWGGFLTKAGFEKGDYIVASELYGKTLAEEVGGVFMPYDINRSVYPAKATKVRKDPLNNFDWILPEFQYVLHKTVTVFGAESTGKTTLSKELAKNANGHLLFEWARPYLETMGANVTPEVMRAIWMGQKSLQRHGYDLRDKPFTFQDTDLYSTIGYWEMWAERWGVEVPEQLKFDAENLKSDLYLITKSNIPFEKDQLRYGGDVREGSDEFWIGICEKYDLNYKIIESQSLWARIGEAKNICETFFNETAHIKYDRITA